MRLHHSLGRKNTFIRNYIGRSTKKFARIIARIVLELQYMIIERMLYEQLCKLVSNFLSKSIFGHSVSLSINVPLVCNDHFLAEVLHLVIRSGELPFQPFAGTRKDRAMMKRILDTKPTGCISGLEESSGGEILWSQTLPKSCRLSTDLKQRLEILLRRLLESNRNKLMTFREFFNETDRIFHLIPIYYLNLKRFILTCHYFEPNQSIIDLFDQLKQQNHDRNDEQYYCLFQK